MTQISDKLFKDGFLIINNCIDTKVTNNIVKKINVLLLNYIDRLKLKRKKNLTDNFNQLAKKTYLILVFLIMVIWVQILSIVSHLD